MTGTCSVSPARLDAQSHEVGGLSRDTCLMHREADPTSLLFQHLEFDFPVCYAKTPGDKEALLGRFWHGEGWGGGQRGRLGWGSPPSQNLLQLISQPLNSSF